MKNNHVADAKHSGKTAFLHRLSTAAPVVLLKAPPINYGLAAPVLAAALIASGAMLACGASDEPSQPGNEQPTATSVVQSQDANDTSNRNAERQTGSSSSGSQGSPTEPAESNRETPTEPTATKKPTAKPTPRPTATPTPEPTPTPVIDPTPGPKRALFYALEGHSNPHGHPDPRGTGIDLNKLRDHNVDLMIEAIIPHMADYIQEHYQEEVFWMEKETLAGC